MTDGEYTIELLKEAEFRGKNVSMAMCGSWDLWETFASDIYNQLRDEEWRPSGNAFVPKRRKND